MYGVELIEFLTMHSPPYSVLHPVKASVLNSSENQLAQHSDGPLNQGQVLSGVWQGHVHGGHSLGLLHFTVTAMSPGEHLRQSQQPEKAGQSSRDRKM